MERRWDLVRAHMRTQGIDAIVVQGFDDPLSGYLRWFCDFGSPSYMKVVLFFADAPMVSIEHGALEGRRTVDPESLDNPGVDTIVSASAFASVSATHLYEARSAVAELRMRNCKRIGLLRPTGMTSGFLDHLKAELKSATFTDETEALDRLKAVKSPEELQQLREACRIQDEVFATLLAAIRPGMRDVDLVALAEHEFRLRGAEDGTMAGGSAPAGKPAMLKLWRHQNRLIEQGDAFTILLELSGPSGYYGEMARQVVLGRPTSEHRDAFDVVLAAQQATRDRMRAGASCAELADAHDAFMTAAGYGPEPRLFSHSQGYDMVERPLVRRDESMSLAAGMFLSCHPAIGSPSVFAFLCDNFIVGQEGGAQRVHTTEQKIFEV